MNIDVMHYFIYLNTAFIVVVHNISISYHSHLLTVLRSTKILQKCSLQRLCEIDLTPIIQMFSLVNSRSTRSGMTRLESKFVTALGRFLKLDSCNKLVFKPLCSQMQHCWLCTSSNIFIWRLSSKAEHKIQNKLSMFLKYLRAHVWDFFDFA